MSTQQWTTDNKIPQSSLSQQKQKFFLSVKITVQQSQNYKCVQVPTTSHLPPRPTCWTLETRNLFVSQPCYCVGGPLFRPRSNPWCQRQAKPKSAQGAWMRPVCSSDANKAGIKWALGNTVRVPEKLSSNEYVISMRRFQYIIFYPPWKYKFFNNFVFLMFIAKYSYTWEIIQTHQSQVIQSKRLRRLCSANEACPWKWIIVLEVNCTGSSGELLSTWWSLRASCDLAALLTNDSAPWIWFS